MKRVRILVTHDLNGVTYTAGTIVVLSEQTAWDMIELNRATDNIGAVTYIAKA